MDPLNRYAVSLFTTTFHIIKIPDRTRLENEIEKSSSTLVNGIETFRFHNSERKRSWIDNDLAAIWKDTTGMREVRREKSR